MTEIPDPAINPPVEEGLVRRSWKRLWNWLLSLEVHKASVYALILFFMLYLPLPYFGRIVQGWFWDRGLFYDTTREGAIIVDSPQLFTRESLINQRLNDSDWIEGRIEEVDNMVEENRFGLPHALRERHLAQQLTLSDRSAAEGQGEGNGTGHSESEQGNTPKIMTPKIINVNPRDAFSEAHEFRQFLVQKKYESVLDDAHDTHSNTLHRLNFNLVLSPGRRYSSSIAAASVRLQQPTDPQWLLQRYGALLIDIRDELVATATDLIADRITFLRPDNTRDFPVETDRLLRREIERLAKEINHRNRSMPPHQPVVDFRALIVNEIKDADSISNQVVGRFIQRQINELAPGTKIGGILASHLFIEGGSSGSPGRSQQNTAPSGDQRTQPDRLPVSTDRPQTEQTAQTNAPAEELEDRQKAAQTMFSQINGPCNSTINFLPVLPPDFSDWPIYDDLIKELRESWPHLYRDKPLENETQLHIQLRSILFDAQISPPCIQKRSIVATKAMLRVLGFLAIYDKLPWSAKNCFVSSGQVATNGSGPKRISRECSELKRKLSEIGIIHLVQAELKNTPIDSVGRVRRLSDYFHLDTEDCDLNTCNLAVKTISEQMRDEFAKASRSGELEPNEIRIVQRVGNNEALRLFAELSCFSNARSYTVYPRMGAGLNVRQEIKNEKSIFSLFGTWKAGVSESQAEVDQERRNYVFGIGDSGQQSRDQEIECGPSFFEVLNSIDVKKEIVPQMKALLDPIGPRHPKNPVLDPRWRGTVKCLLAAEVNRNGKVGVDNMKSCMDVDYGDDQEAPSGWEEFTFHNLFSVVRIMRQRDTTISWVVHPVETPLQGSGHIARSEPLSALVSIPSWWPGLEIIVETCWLRPRWLRHDTSTSLCDDAPDTQHTLVPLFDTYIEEAKARGRIQNMQMLPLPYDLDDVLPKLGFFIVRYPYVDRFDATAISLETGRRAQLRLTGKRLWKNPRVRIGEQWHDQVEVLPDMRGIVATFDCLAPLRQPGSRVIDERLGSKQKGGANSAPTHNMLGWTTNAADPKAIDDQFAELRQVEVWTSEGNSNPTNVQVRAFRPVAQTESADEPPCWPVEEVKQE